MVQDRFWVSVLASAGAPARSKTQANVSESDFRCMAPLRVRVPAVFSRTRAPSKRICANAVSRTASPRAPSRRASPIRWVTRGHDASGDVPALAPEVAMESASLFVDEPARRTRVTHEADVLVVGGGSAGVAAAIAAARDGADVLLAERYGSLGGLATGGLIVLLLTLDDGRGRQVVAGLCQELTERMARRDAAHFPPREQWGSADAAQVEEARRWGLVWGHAPHVVRYSVAYDPEEMRHAFCEMLREAGVRVLFHAWACEPLL